MTTNRPNIVYILADDLGYGDLSCLNPEGKIHTPHADAMAASGLTFTNAHSSSAVSTPSRYAILTGRYNWRSRLKSGIVGSFCQHLIESNRMTVASCLRGQGYHTACVGKWHLGMDWVKKSEVYHDVDYTQPIANGPNAFGFDYFYGLAGSCDMPPYAYIENDRVTSIPHRRTVSKDAKAYWREGLASDDFKHIEALQKLTDKAVGYIHERAATGKPFFLYFPLPAPHTPIIPSPEFLGSSNTNLYGDFVRQMDDVIGQIRKALRASGVADNTLLIFTSDNGCSPRVDYAELAMVGHNPSHVFRGTKSDIYEGGHHIPYIAEWPAAICPGRVCNELICQTELLRTCAEIAGAAVPDEAAEDSISILPLLTDTSCPKPVFPVVISHSLWGAFSIIQGEWKLELCPDSGGWSEPVPLPADAFDPPLRPRVQLYNLRTDISERYNVFREHPEIVHELYQTLVDLIAQGRSTPGKVQNNDESGAWPQRDKVLALKL